MLKKTEVTFVSKLGTTRAGERTRIWIEGKRLTDIGFQPGDHFKRAWTDHSLQLDYVSFATFKSLPAAERGTISGKGDKPIIDIAGQQVAQVFGSHATHVQVTYHRHKIIIEPMTK